MTNPSVKRYMQSDKGKAALKRGQENIKLKMQSNLMTIIGKLENIERMIQELEKKVDH